MRCSPGPTSLGTCGTMTTSRPAPSMSTSINCERKSKRTRGGPSTSKPCAASGTGSPRAPHEYPNEALDLLCRLVDSLHRHLRQLHDHLRGLVQPGLQREHVLGPSQRDCGGY